MLGESLCIHIIRVVPTKTNKHIFRLIHNRENRLKMKRKYTKQCVYCAPHYPHSSSVGKRQFIIRKIGMQLLSCMYIV